MFNRIVQLRARNQRKRQLYLMNRILSHTDTSEESTQRTMDAKYVESDDGRLIAESDGAEIEEFIQNMGNQNCLISIADSDDSEKEDAPLHLAAERGDTEAVRSLLMSSANVDVLDTENNTPLHYAAKNDHVEVVNLLISKNADVNACNNTKKTPLHLACQNGHTRVVGILLDNHAVVDVTTQSEETPFCLAAKSDHADVAELLINRGVCDFLVTPPAYETPLHVAIKEGHKKVAKVILKYSLEHQESVNSLTEAMDIKAIQALKPDGRCVSAEAVLTKKHIPLEILRNSEGCTALDIAVRSSSLSMVQLLLNGDQCSYSEEDLRRTFDTWMERIIFDQRVEIVQALIHSRKFNANHHNNRGLTPLHGLMHRINSLHMPAKKFKPIEQIINHVIRLLLEKGADCNRKTSTGQTPLIIASKKGFGDAILILFDWEEKSGLKLDLDARDRYGATALIKAAERLHVSVVQLLLSHGASVNLYDFYGYTALHAAIVDEPITNWFDLHFFSKDLLKRIYDRVDPLAICPNWRNETLDPHAVIERLHNYLKVSSETTRRKEEVVRTLLANDEINVNAVDLTGNTPLDLAVASSKRITPATIEALKTRGAIRKSLEPEDESSIEMSRIDERGRNPLHRLMISHISDDASKNGEAIKVSDRLDLKVSEILVSPESFMELTPATDHKGRTPLHYCVMLPTYLYENADLANVLWKLGSNVNATDMHGKTPLHYVENYDDYELLVRNGADESTKDKQGRTPKDLWEIKKVKKDNARSFKFEAMKLCASEDIDQLVFNTKHVTELTRLRLFESVRINSQSHRSEESSEDAIWRMWTETDLFGLNRRLSQLKPSVQDFIERLADGIKEKDERFECQPILVGSAYEETKAVISTDFDFNFRLVKFSQLCEPCPHPLGTKGYFQLRRKSNEDAKIRTDDKFDNFFNLDQCLLTNEVNYRFKIILDEVLGDPTPWRDEHRFDWNIEKAYTRRNRILFGMCKTLSLKMINPSADGEGGLLFADISIDIVASVQVMDWWPDDPLPVGINPSVKASGSTFVFARPLFDPTKPDLGSCSFSETFAKISFAPLESRTIKESSPVIKAAYLVCKMLLYDQPKSTYQLKNCLLFCMEALNPRNISKARNDDEITPKKLAFWVERIMFCFLEFSRHGVYPCCFMSSFRQQVLLHDRDSILELQSSKANVPTVLKTPFRYSEVYHLYLRLRPDDTSIDVPISHMTHHRGVSIHEAKDDLAWEHFNREEFVRTLSSRSMATNQ